MNLEPLKDKLGDETFSKLEAYVSEIIGKRDAAVAEIATTRKGLRAENEKLKTLRDKLFEKLGLEDDTDIDSLPEVKGQAEAFKQFEAKLKRLEREKSEALARAGDVESKWKSSRLDAALAKAISAHEFLDNDIVARYVSADVQWEDDQIMMKAGDKLMPLEDGVKLIAQTKPHLLKSQGRSGSGSPTGAGSSGGQKNPFAKNTFNLTEQISMQKENPALAAQLKTAAGA